MEHLYTTKRLILRTLDESAAPAVLDFYYTNRNIFEPWEPLRPANFYTVNYQRSLLNAERNLLSRSQGVRFFLFEAENPTVIIGTINFYNMMRAPDSSCKLGYKLAASALHKGYAYEAITAMIPIIIKDYHIERIEADIMPNNRASLRLIERMRFTYEGLSRNCCEIQGRRQTHRRYSFLSTDMLPRH